MKKVDWTLYLGGDANETRDHTGAWEQLWYAQMRQQAALGMDPEAMTELERERAAKDLQLGIYEEAAEMARACTQYKRHLLRAPAVERANVVDAAADLLKYVLAMCQLHGIGADELREGIVRKTDEVSCRAEGERLELERHTPLIVTDLDGCVADLSEFSSQLSTISDGRELDDRIIGALEDLKSRFYRSGGFATVPTIPGAPEGLRKIKAAGFKIVVVTARPHWQFKRIYADTREWFARHDIPHDKLLFNKDKADAIIEHVFPARPAWFIEDRSKHAIELAAIGIRVLLIDTPNNQDIKTHPLIRRVKGWDEITEIILGEGESDGKANQESVAG